MYIKYTIKCILENAGTISLFTFGATRLGLFGKNRIDIDKKPDTDIIYTHKCNIFNDTIMIKTTHVNKNYNRKYYYSLRPINLYINGVKTDSNN